jgi:hypothetical protein
LRDTEVCWIPSSMLNSTQVTWTFYLWFT